MSRSSKSWKPLCLSHNFEPEGVETSGWFQPIRSILAPMMYNVPFLRHVTSNKSYDFFWTNLDKIENFIEFWYKNYTKYIILHDHD